jgi:hypothetical protein
MAMPWWIPVASHQECSMRVNWVLSSEYRIDPTIDPDHLKMIGPIWGSWRTWRSCSTDNVICYDFSKAQELLARAFQSVCNFYVPRKYYQDLGRPLGVKLYDGEFSHEVDYPEDIVSMHLASGTSDIVLLLGFDFSTPNFPEDKMATHKLKNWHGLIRSIISADQTIQWAAVDHQTDLDNSYQILPNFTCDTMENALKLLL